uniref:Uncharacterized protein n=1 Tax=Bactrocera dorsalis TaxID=27457 RepID=A0A034W216_BACDO
MSADFTSIPQHMSTCPLSELELFLSYLQHGSVFPSTFKEPCWWRHNFTNNTTKAQTITTTPTTTKNVAVQPPSAPRAFVSPSCSVAAIQMGPTSTPFTGAGWWRMKPSAHAQLPTNLHAVSPMQG